MKAKWHALPKGGDKIKEVRISDLKNIINLSSENAPNLKTRLGRHPYISFTQWSNKPERLFILSNGNLAIAFRNVLNMDYIKVFDCDTAGYVADFTNGGDYDITELYSKSQSKLETIFPSTFGNSLAIYEDNTYSFTAGHWGHSYLAVHNGRVYAAKSGSNYVNGYEENDYLWAGKRQLTFYVDGKRSPCTGLFSFKDKLIYFSNHSMHAINIRTDKTKGKDAAGKDFEIIEDVVMQERIADDIGCRSNYSIANVGGRLIWLGQDGVYEYDGRNNPRMISRQINKEIKEFNFDNLWIKPEGFALGGKYYLTICEKAPYKNKVFVYDTENSEWQTYQYETPIFSFAVYDGMLLGVAIDSKIYALERDNSNENISWSLEIEVDKATQKIEIVSKKDVNMQIGAKLKVNGVEIKDLENVDDAFVIPNLLFTTNDKAAIKIYGTGVIEIEKIYKKGGE
ncbi:MAG: hypothetical protein FWE47_01345 [Oscillospiraceae bacterium]|nr:hypothetical protein [Oscillospiraceae bacterium]